MMFGKLSYINDRWSNCLVSQLVSLLIRLPCCCYNVGGVLGLTFTSVEYRGRGFAAAMFNESCKRHAAIGDLMTCESKDIMPVFKSWILAMEGRSQIIAIY